MEPTSTEKHFTVYEIAEMWGVSHWTIRRLFEKESGVLVFGSPETRYGRKRVTMRIPESVLNRVYRSRCNQ